MLPALRRSATDLRTSFGNGTGYFKYDTVLGAEAAVCMRWLYREFCASTTSRFDAWVQKFSPAPTSLTVGTVLSIIRKVRL
jgi:hypothetical protein